VITRRTSVLFPLLLVTFLSALALPAQADDYQITLDEVHLFVDKTLVPVEQDIECWAWCDYTLTLPQGEEEELEAGGEGDVYVKEIYTWNWNGGNATSIEGDHHYKVNYAASGNYTIQVTCNVEVRRVGSDELLASAGPTDKSTGVTIFEVKITTPAPASFPFYKEEDAGNTISLGCTVTPSGASGGTFKWSKASGVGTPTFSPNDSEQAMQLYEYGTITVKVEYTKNGMTAEDTSGNIIHFCITNNPSGSRPLWYFNGANAANYPEQMTTSVIGITTGTFAWTVTAGTDKVDFGNNSDSQTITDNSGAVIVKSTGASTAEDDVNLELKHNGTKIADHKVTVSAPQHNELLSDQDSEWGENPCDFEWQAPLFLGFMSYHEMIVKDMFGQVIPAALELNETFSGTPVSDYDDEEWSTSLATQGPWWIGADGKHNDAYKAQFPYPSVPTSVNPGDEGWETKVYHQMQYYKVGTQTAGGGRIIETHTLQIYRGKGRQE